MIDVKYKDIVKRLLDVIPELSGKYNKEVTWWAPEEPPPDVVYGDMFSDYVSDLERRCTRECSASDQEQLRRAFDLIEELASSSDIETRCIIEVSVLESLLGDKGGVKRFARFMKARTKNMAANLADRWELETEELM